MRKILQLPHMCLLMVSMLFSTMVFGQGNEDFSNLPTTSSGSYLGRSWEGTDEGKIWTAASARTDQTLNGKAITTNGSGRVTSPEYEGGMGVLQFNYVRAFTGTGGRILEVWVNGEKIGSTIAVSSTTNNVVQYSREINIEGDVVLEIRTSGAQIIIDDVQWTGYVAAPTVTTNPATAITTDGATFNGTINSNGLTTAASFAYGLTTSYGQSASATPSSVTGSSDTAVSASIGGLQPNTRYHFRAVGTVDGTPTNGNDATFYTHANVPGLVLLGDVTHNSVAFAVDAATENGNPSATEFAIRVNGFYVQADGSLGDTEAWQTAAAWGTTVVTGLLGETEYIFDSKARNNDLIETAFGPSDAATTQVNVFPTVILTSAAPDFGTSCLNISAVLSFTFDGMNLNGSALATAPLSGFEFSTDNVVFQPTINIPYVGGTISSQTVYVRFTPSAVVSYDGSIVITGGGLAEAYEVPVTAEGVNTPAAATTGAASAVTSTTATLAGSASEACSEITSYGIEVFQNGTLAGTFAGTPSAANFSSAVSSLEANTTYTFRAFATDASGTVYGEEVSFTTSELDEPLAVDASDITSNSFTAVWEPVTGATSYRLDVATTEDFETVIYSSDLIISEYIEGSSNHKYLEIYNGTGAAVNLADYALVTYMNGATSETATFGMSGTLANGEAIVYRHSSASLHGSLTTISTGTFLQFNGDDAVALRKNGEDIDVFGIIGTQQTYGQDVTLRRKAGVINPTTTYDPAQWDSYPQNTVDGLGAHTMNNVVSDMLPGYDNLQVSGLSQAVSGLQENTTYYYRVRAESALSTSANSNTIEVTTSTMPATFSGISQGAGVVCEDSEATFNLTGLLAGSTSTIYFNINGAAGTVNGVLADASGNASFTWELSAANNGQTLTVTAIERTDVPVAAIDVTSNNTVILSVNPYVTYYADVDGDGFGNPDDSIVTCQVPEGYVTIAGDCDDNNDAVHPNAAEIGYNLIDDNCDGQIDEGFAPVSTTPVLSSCGVVLTSLDDQIFANLVAGAQGYRWRVTTLSGPDAGQVQFLDTPLRVMKLSKLANYAYDATYRIEVAVYYQGFLQPFTETACAVTTAVPAAQLTNCNTTINRMSDIIYADLIPYATGYRFRITDPTNPSNTQTIDRVLRDFRMSLVTDFPVQYNKTYNVDIAIRNTDGNYLAYGSVCPVTTPPFPTTGIADNQCDGEFGYYQVPSMSTQIYAVSYPGAIAYAFRLTGPGLPGGQAEVVRNLRTFKLSDFAGLGLIPGELYSVNVRLIFDEEEPAGNYGKTCMIQVPGALRMKEVAFDAAAYPNPFAESFHINIQSNSSEPVNVKVYDMAGRILDNTTAASADELSVGAHYPAGVYNVIVTQGDQVKSLRVIKR